MRDPITCFHPTQFRPQPADIPRYKLVRARALRSYFGELCVIWLVVLVGHTKLILRKPLLRPKHSKHMIAWYQIQNKKQTSNTYALSIECGYFYGFHRFNWHSYVNIEWQTTSNYSQILNTLLNDRFQCESQTYAFGTKVAKLKTLPSKQEGALFCWG